MSMRAKNADSDPRDIKNLIAAYGATALKFIMAFMFLVYLHDFLTIERYWSSAYFSDSK